MENLIKIFGSKCKGLEILMLLKGFKPVVRQGFYEEELEEVESFCKENHIFLIKSNFKVTLEGTEFSNKGLKIGVDDLQRGMMFVYISKDESKANKAASFENQGDHKGLGGALSYPDCCTAFFDKYEPNMSKLDNNYEVPLVQESSGNAFSFYNNVFLRHKDYCLLSHFPCNLNCEKSLSMAKKNFEVLKENNPEIAQDFIENLKGELIVNDRKINFI